MKIQTYWQEPAKIQRIIKSRTRAVAAHGSLAWNVRGQITVEETLFYCDCEHCKGHSEGKQVLDVDVITLCTFDEAKYRASVKTLTNEGYDYDSKGIKWTDGPHIEEICVFGNSEEEQCAPACQS